MSESSQEPTLISILQAYLEAVDAGQKPDREELLSRHPDLADELRGFFADQEKMDRFAQSLHKAQVVEATVGVARSAENSPLPDTAEGQARKPPARIRYVGDYELLEEIARGAMGVVYKARQLSLNRVVAVKMILAGLLATKADRDRFHAEAQAAALLDHPSIVPVFEVGEYEGQHYFSMGYVEGQSLAARLADGPLPPKEAAELLVTVAEAVEYAHRQGVIHRDIKPSNILIDSKGRPRVTDFGLAKRVEAPGTPSRGKELTATGQVLGTPSYMSPEQAAGRIDAAGPAADIYSLGALLYTTLAGRPPFQAATALETLQQVLDQEPVALRQLNAAVPRDLETIVLKCLEKSVPRRYASAQALAEDLGRYLEGRPILARPVGQWEHAWRWCRREPMVAGLSAALIFALLAGTTASTYFAVNERRRAIESDANAAQADKNAREARDYAARLQVSEAQEKANAKRAMEAKALAEASARQAKESQRRAEESQRRAEDMAKKVIDANNREIAARVDALLPDAQFSKTDIGYLEEQVRAAGDNLQIVDARFQAGTVTELDRSAAKAQLCTAKGRLAWAKGDLLHCQKQYDDAVAAWKVSVAVVDAQYRVGTVDYPARLAAEASLHQAELCASKVKGRIARGPNPAQSRDGPTKAK
jgi:eukaryotic-like serine/threonine-protein kinase